MSSLIVTASGGVIDPINPDPADIKIEDIGHALSNSCRFTGHVRQFYSVAEHSVRVASILPPEYKLVGLLHDASEAYLSDLARPIKKESDLGTYYEWVERRLEKALAEHFALPWPWPEQVRWADNELLWAEIRDLMPASDDPRLLQWSTETSYTETIEPWTPERAKREFLRAYRELVSA